MSDTQEADLGLLGRAARIGTVLTRYGLGERGAADVPLEERAKSLRAALEELGPTFAKLGQILSTRPDLLPPEFIAELSTLQDQVPPMTEAEVVEVMEGELRVPWEDVFDHIDPEPLAAGTIGQVHAATLENGDRVVVKVQRLGAEEEIMRDLGLLELFAEKAENRAGLRRLVDFPSVIRHLSESLKRELDFRMEAANVDRLGEVLERYSRLAVPSVYHELSSKRLLVLSFVDGVPIRDTPDVPERYEAARQLIESYYRQVLVDGFFHADPHPGNLLWSDGSVYFLDCGMVGEVDPRIRELVLLLVMAFWQEDDEFLAEIVLQLADQELPDTFDMTTFEHELAQLLSGVRGQSLQEIQLGPILQGITEIAARHDVRLPAELALTGKALAQMQLAATVPRPRSRSVLRRRPFPREAPVRAEPQRDRPEAGVLRGAEGEGEAVGARRGGRTAGRRAAGPALPGRHEGDGQPREHDQALDQAHLAGHHGGRGDHLQRVHARPERRLDVGAGAVRQHRAGAALPDARRPLLETRQR